MPYVIAAACIDITDKSCMEECPVDCIVEGDRKLYINPAICIDCGACEPVCPVEAISQDRRVPDAHNANRLRLIGNVNPHLHYPVDAELQRQLDLGAVALKIHPVHAGVSANDRALYPAYELCQSSGVAVVVHCGTSTFPGSMNSF